VRSTRSPTLGLAGPAAVTITGSSLPRGSVCANASSSQAWTSRVTDHERGTPVTLCATSLVRVVVKNAQQPDRSGTNRTLPWPASGVPELNVTV
jgi:hypothetical protein